MNNNGITEVELTNYSNMSSTSTRKRINGFKMTLLIVLSVVCIIFLLLLLGITPLGRMLQSVDWIRELIARLCFIS